MLVKAPSIPALLCSATGLEVRSSLVGRSLPLADMAGLLLTSLGSIATTA
jgi:hypothetical protein